MKPENHNSELIDRYLEGTLNTSERHAFEAQLRSDEAFASEVRRHKKLLDDLSFLGKRKQLQLKLNTFHATMEAEENTGLKRLVNFKVFRNKYLPTVGIAASVAMISVFSTLFTLDYMKSVEKSQQSNYRVLKREVDNLKKSQKAIVNGTIPAPLPSLLKYGGSGFALSSDGYVVTNYHVVSKSDSIFIESNTNEKRRYKVQLVYADQESDLAVLKVVSPDFKSFGPLPYSFKRKSADLGENIFTLAYPREDIVYGEGSISSKTGYEGDSTAYQVSIPVNPGNSGGPVFDSKGNIIGILAGKQAESEGVAFARKSENLMKVLKNSPDSLIQPIRLPQNNKLGELKRTEQLRKIQDFVFNIKVY